MLPSRAICVRNASGASRQHFPFVPKDTEVWLRICSKTHLWIPRQGFLRFTTTPSFSPRRQRGAGAETFKGLNMDPPERPCCLLCMISPSRCAPSSGVHVSAERPSGVLSRGPCAGCYLSGERRQKHISSMTSRPGLFTNVIATTVATSRHF